MCTENIRLFKSAQFEAEFLTPKHFELTGFYSISFRLVLLCVAN